MMSYAQIAKEIGSNENAVQGGLKLWDTPTTPQSAKKTPRTTKAKNGK